ncbi:MAG TPA: CsbD family protein [Candidatus Limnocylindrales bacterium]|nr:CsbD family protein [Candidatus Limnocylindrales bacterium]
MGNDDQFEGKFEQARGDVKENLGDAMGNEQMENEGKLDQAKGNVREGLGDVREGIDDAVDSVRDKDDR